METVKDGQLVIVTTGSYSEYGIRCLSKATRDFNLTSVSDLYLTRYPEERLKWNFRSRAFSSWLISEGYLEKVLCLELHACEDDGPDIYLKEV